MDVVNYVSVIASAIGAVTAIWAITRFLQKGQIESSLTRKEIELLKAELLEAQHSEFRRPSEINSIVNSLKKEIEEVRGDLSHLTNEERQKIIEGLKNSLKSAAANDVLDEIREKIESQTKEKSKRSILERNFDKTINRLKDELFSLSKRSSLNLAIGVVTTLIGLGLLGIFILSTPVDFENTMDFVESFVPRLSLVVFIEIFAYFFLRLYKDTLTEIKYFQNEITNIESKHLAIELATTNESEEGVIRSIDSLLSTERNHILSKGQTTVEIEKARTEQQLTDSVMNKISSVFSKSPNRVAGGL